MPLPAALQARLKQRGLIQAEPASKKDKDEEVFAESYDKSDDSDSTSGDNDSETENSNENLKIANCPNRSNQYHECSTYCKKKYGTKKFEPHPIFERRRIRMLKIYPLPLDWIEVPDANTNRYYYWNTVTDQVCWLSPSHPKAKFEYAKNNKTNVKEADEEEDEAGEDDDDEDEEEDEEEEEEDIDELLTSYEKNDPKETAKNKHYNLTKQARRMPDKQGRSKRVKANIDPMDPSAYSDTPHGKWSSGLNSAD